MAIDWLAIAPEIALAVTALVVLAADVSLRGEAKRLANPISIVGTVVAIGFALRLWGDPRSTFEGMFVVNDFAVLFKLVFLGALVAILLMSYRWFAEGRYWQGEYYFLLLTAFLGMLLMPSSRDLLLLFVALETISVPGFVMAGLRKRDLYSSEASIKFFLIGVVCVAIMLFGMSLVYGFTGTTQLEGIAAALAAEAAPAPLLLASILLVFAGFGFKISVVPFHFWAPDTYAGSPMPVTAMLAVASKAAGFAGLAVVVFVAFEPLAHVWAPVVAVLALLTMTLGNLVALQQRDVIRLLAYSSIAHAGWMLIPFGFARAGLAELNDQAAQAVLFYVIAYAFMNLGVFGVAIAVYLRNRERSLAQYAGLGSRAPVLALCMTVFLISLGGIPPTVGFWAKFEVFRVVALDMGGGDVAIAAILVVNAVLALFYYLKVARTMWIDEAPAEAPLVRPGLALHTAVGALAVGTIVLGLVPGLVTSYSSLTSVVAGP